MKKGSQTIFVDFKNKQVVKVVENKPKRNKKDPFKNFNPLIPGSNFTKFSDEERLEYSDHVIKHIHEASFEDLVFWANNGMIDMKKANKKLGLYEEKPKSRLVGENKTTYFVEDDGGFINPIPKQSPPNLGAIMGMGLDDDEVS